MVVTCRYLVNDFDKRSSIKQKNNDMNFDNFTIKAQEAVNHAVKIAEGNNQQAIETGHLLKGLMVNAESVTGFLLKKLGG